jgi:hypothetical protein
VRLSPTLMREVSTFTYESEPAFFADPFFLREADPAVLAELRDPKRQQALRESRSAQGLQDGPGSGEPQPQEARRRRRPDRDVHRHGSTGRDDACNGAVVLGMELGGASRTPQHIRR